MTTPIGTKSSPSSKPSRSPKSTRCKKKNGRRTVQKPNGELGPRVKKVGADKFALVCVDPAKHRSELLMADYLGNILLEPRTVEHQAALLEVAILQVREAREKHGILDLIVTIERTGTFHRPVQLAFRQAGFETRIVHPFATKQYRLPADPGKKTDHTDLYAQHRAAIAGFGLQEPELDELSRRLQLRIRHRRDLVEKTSALACQIREHLHLALPGFAELFSDLFACPAALAVARLCASPQAVLQRAVEGLRTQLRQQQIAFQTPTLEKIFAWAGQAQRRTLEPSAPLHHAIATDLLALYQTLENTIHTLEREVAHDLVRTPYVRLLLIPGIHVVSAADFAGEMGPIANYANANAITGRSGLYPSRYQSDQTDHDGSLVRQCNRRLRATLMRIADNLCRFNGHFRGLAGVARATGKDEREIRVVAAKKFSRIAFAAVAGEEPLRHPCVASPQSILRKLFDFHHEHGTPPDAILTDLEAAVSQLSPRARGLEAELVRVMLPATRRRGAQHVSALLLGVLAKYGLNTMESQAPLPSGAAETSSSPRVIDPAEPSTANSRGTTAPN